MSLRRAAASDVPPRIFCDTSFFYACLDRSDVNHEEASAILEKLAGGRCALFVTWDVISETATLLRYRRSYRAAETFLKEIKPELRVIAYGERVRGEAEEIFLRYGRGHRLSFCDAISFVVVTTLLKNLPTLSFDEDFARLGLTVIRKPSRAGGTA